MARGPATPFGEQLPLVKGVAFDPETLSLALVAEDEEGNIDLWRELLFAASGLRHALSQGERPALSAPLVIALVSEQRQELELQQLIQELEREYVLFTRLEISLLRTDRLGHGQELSQEEQTALAPLLWSCRRALARKDAIGAEALGSFAEELREAVHQNAERLGDPLESHAEAAAERLVSALVEEIQPGSDPGRAVLPNWRRVRMINFRAFAKAECELGQVTVVEGLNGTGKSSLFEALEILGSRTSQRKPDDVSASIYGQHLNRNGTESFAVEGAVESSDEFALRVSKIDDAEGLPRSFLSQDAVAAIASADPASRYSQLLRTAGLRLPTLDDLREQLNRQAHSELNNVLRELGASEMDRISANALGRVRDELGKAPQLALVDEELEASRERVTKLASKLDLEYRAPAAEMSWLAELPELNSELAEVAKKLSSSSPVTSRAKRVSAQAAIAAAGVKQEAAALEVIVSAAVRWERAQKEAPRTPSAELETTMLPHAVGRRWLASANSLQRDLDALASDRGRVRDENIGARLDRYIEALRAAVEATPFEAIQEALSTQPSAPEKSEELRLGGDVVSAAGFSDLELDSIDRQFRVALSELASTLRRQQTALQSFSDRLARHPGVQLFGHESELAEALAVFELARGLREPIERAQETMVERLIRGPLQPVLVELLSALTRFEWYFKPLQLSVESGRIAFSGMVTGSDKLEARLVLNTAEKAVLGIAWFLALFLLQRPEKRRLLMLDDPMGLLDADNQAAFISVLRAFARLTKPDLVLCSTHDPGLADVLERELAQVGDWPRDFRRLHFVRDSNSQTAIEDVTSEVDKPDPLAEIGRLGSRELGVVAH